MDSRSRQVEPGVEYWDDETRRQWLFLGTEYHNDANQVYLYCLDSSTNDVKVQLLSMKQCVCQTSTVGVQECRTCRHNPHWGIGNKLLDTTDSRRGGVKRHTLQQIKTLELNRKKTYDSIRNKTASTRRMRALAEEELSSLFHHPDGSLYSWAAILVKVLGLGLGLGLF